MSEYRWKDVSVVGFDELMNALDRADRKGYMPDALKEEWEAFNWKPAQSQQEPVAWIDKYGNAFPLAAKQYSVVGKHWKPLYTSPPAQRKPLTDEQMVDYLGDRYHIMTENELEFFRLGEAAHSIKEKSNG